MAENLNQVIEGFGLTQVLVLDGSTSFETATAANSYVLHGGRSASVTLNTASVDNTGEDTIMSTWNSVDNATITIESGYLSLPAYSFIYGETINSTGASPNEMYDFDPWTEDSINAVGRPVLLVMRSKNLSKTIYPSLKLGLYSVEFQPIKFTGPQYRNVLAVNMEGKAGMSTIDELGATMAKKSCVKVLVDYA